jgi:hypothetical protein
MNKHIKLKNSNPPIHPCCPCLELVHATAKEVFVAGSFNDWHPALTPMIALGDGRWAKELALPPGRYEYRFVVDGQWADDAKATEIVPNPYGGVNAVLVIATPVTGADHSHNAEAHHSQDAEGDSHDSHKHESKEDSCCSTLKAVVPTAKAIVFDKQAFHPTPFLCVLLETHAASLALSENPPNRQAKPRDWVFTPEVCLGPAHRSLAPPSPA